MLAAQVPCLALASPRWPFGVVGRPPAVQSPTAQHIGPIDGVSFSSSGRVLTAVSSVCFAVRGRQLRTRRRAQPEPASSSARSDSEKAAVIVGGGPSGLAAALMLAERGWGVTVLERGNDVTRYEPTRGFMYLIDGRGQKVLNMLDGDLLERLKAASVCMQEAPLCLLDQKGATQTTTPFGKAKQKSYWLPRHKLVSLLYEEVQRRPLIQVVLGAEIEEFKQDGAQFSVHATTKDGPLTSVGSLLVGADGINSVVRAKLEEWDGGRGRFVPREFSSPAAGLRYKVLTLPKTISVKTSEGPVDFEPESFLSVKAATTLAPRLGLIPTPAAEGRRTANIITKPGHPFWEVDDVDGFREYAAKQWPHFPFDDLVSEGELARFAADRGGYFPNPQHSPNASWAPQAGNAGAVILGDALHAFPPDVGQGVNSALEDIMQLAEALDNMGDAQPSQTARHFGEERMPDVEALVQICRVAGPYQYSQSVWGKRLWTAGILTRVLLHKLIPGTFDKHSVFLLQQSELPYREVWRRGQRGARNASIFLLSAALGVGGALARLLL